MKLITVKHSVILGIVYKTGYPQVFQGDSGGYIRPKSHKNGECREGIHYFISVIQSHLISKENEVDLNTPLFVATLMSFMIRNVCLLLDQCATCIKATNYKEYFRPAVGTDGTVQALLFA